MSAIYITGDCHASFNRFSTKNFPDQRNMNRDDYMIVCGDFGGVWSDTPQERYWLDWLSDKPFTLLFVDGNHENFDRLYSDEFEVVDFHGGKAHRIRPNIYHLMRGYVFDLHGKLFWTFGGAQSHDISDGILELYDYCSFSDVVREYNRLSSNGKLVRINHVSWWKEELPTQEEMDFGLSQLRRCNNKVDFVVTHCCPQYVAQALLHEKYKPDILTQYFDEVDATINYTHWFCGHYHTNQIITPKHNHTNQIITPKHTILYQDIQKII